MFGKPGGQCSGVSPWDKPLALQSCRLSGPYVLRDRENFSLVETRPEIQQPHPPLGLAQSDCYLSGVDEDNESAFRVWCAEATWIETTSHLRRFSMPRVFDNTCVSLAHVRFFKTCVLCPLCARHCGRICDGISAHARREPFTHSVTLLRDSVFITTTNTVSSPCTCLVHARCGTRCFTWATLQNLVRHTPLGRQGHRGPVRGSKPHNQ